MKKLLLILFVSLTSGAVFGQTIKWTNGSGDKNINNVDNWVDADNPENEVFGPDSFTHLVFEGSTSALDAIVDVPTEAAFLTIGEGGVPYGTITIKSGGSMINGSGRWTGIGWTTGATVIVEAGGLMQTGSHLWLGFNANSDSNLIIAGTVKVGEMFGINFEGVGGTTTKTRVDIYDGGILELSQFIYNAAGVTFIGTGDNQINIKGGGSITLPGDQTGVFQTYIDNSKIVSLDASNAASALTNAYDVDADLTTVSSTASAEIYVPALSTKDFATLDVELFPNPTSNFINIKSKNPISNVKVYNNLGQLIKEESGKSRIDFSNVSSGYYILKVEDNLGNLGVKKVIKQ